MSLEEGERRKKRRRDLHEIISERQERYTETVLAMGGSTDTETLSGGDHAGDPAGDRTKPVMVAVSQAVCKQNEKFVIKRLKVKMAACFDFRHRTTSFDLHHIGHGAKMNILSKLFRSKSDTNVKSRSPRDSPRDSPKTSPKSSPKSSPGTQPKRRFMRVVRDDHQQGEEYVNPHVIRKYNPGFWEKQYTLQKSRSLDDSDRPLPYTVSGHTILKKHSSLDDNQCGSAGTSPTQEKKHATFKEVVEVCEYHPKTRCKLILEDACIVNEKLHDEWEECLDVEFQVPRTEDESEEVDQASCRAIMDIVLDQVARAVPLENIQEEDGATSTTTPDHTTTTPDYATSQPYATAAVAHPGDVLMEDLAKPTLLPTIPSPDTDVVSPKRTKFEQTDAAGNEP